MAGQGVFWVVNKVPDTHALLLAGLPRTQRRDGKTPAFLSSLEGWGISPALPGQRGNRDSEVAATTVSPPPAVYCASPSSPTSVKGEEVGRSLLHGEREAQGESMLSQCHRELEVALPGG